MNGHDPAEPGRCESDLVAVPNRLRWKCRRGMREVDLLLEAFLRRGYTALDRPDRDRFEALLDYPDQLLWAILLGRMTVSDPHLAALVERIRCAARH